MAIEKGTDSYATVAEADAYHAGLPFNAAWAPLELPRKEQLLRLATRLIDENFEWYGSPVLISQPLAWPRFGLLTRQWQVVTGEEIPGLIVSATAEFALRLHTEDRTGEQVLEELQIRSASGTQFGDVQRRVIPSAVRDIIPSEWVEHVRGFYDLGVVELMRDRPY